MKNRLDYFSVVSNNNKPILIVEAKYSDDKVSKNLLNFQQSLNVPAVQLVNNITDFLARNL